MSRPLSSLSSAETVGDIKHGQDTGPREQGKPVKDISAIPPLSAMQIQLSLARSVSPYGTQDGDDLCIPSGS